MEKKKENIAAIVLVAQHGKPWSNLDGKNYRNLARKKMGAKIIVFKSTFEIEDLKDVSKMLAGEPFLQKELKDYSTVITMIATHGNGEVDEICDMENTTYKLSNIYNAPCQDKDGSLKDVTKIYIIATNAGEKI